MKAKFEIAVAVWLATPLWAGIIIADGTFNSSDYTLGGVDFWGAGPAVSASAITLSTGGRPGSQRVTSFTQPVHSVHTVGEVNTAVVWNPSIQGPITSIEFSADFKANSNLLVQMGFLLRQNRNYFQGNCYQQTSASWTNWDCVFRLPTNNFPQPSSPLIVLDVSADGGPIEFGWFAAVGFFEDVPGSTVLNVDNFCVSVNGGGTNGLPAGGVGRGQLSSACSAAIAAIPEPSSVFTTMGGLGILGLLRRAAHDSGGRRS